MRWPRSTTRSNSAARPRQSSALLPKAARRGAGARSTARRSAGRCAAARSPADIADLIQGCAAPAPLEIPRRAPRSAGGEGCEEKRLKSNYGLDRRPACDEADSPRGERSSAPQAAEKVALCAARRRSSGNERLAAAPLKAILGPDQHRQDPSRGRADVRPSLGMIGFPLRLLAREVYDRVVKLKGANQVALITGEEKILPEGRALVPAAPPNACRWSARSPSSRSTRPSSAPTRARPRLHRPAAARPRPRGDDDPRLGEPEADGPRAGAQGRDHRPAALLDPDLCRARPSSRACRRARRSSPSRPSRSTRSPRCCAGCAAARRW